MNGEFFTSGTPAGIFINGTSSLLQAGKYSKEKRIEELCENIKSYLKARKSVSVPELIKVFHAKADEIIEATKRLKEQGLIQEVNG